MCNKIDAGIECIKCGYPYSEARYPDKDVPLPCNASKKIINKHIKEILATTTPVSVLCKRSVPLIAIPIR